MRKLGSAFKNGGGADENGTFECPLPDHQGPASLVVPPDDPEQDLRLACCTGRWRSLGEVRAAEAYKDDYNKRSNIEIAVWTRELAWRVGAIEPVDVELPPLPPGTDDHVAEARLGFEILLGLRQFDFEPRPAAYSVRFCEAWCGLSHWHAWKAIEELRRLDIIREDHRVGNCRFFVPGEGPTREPVPRQTQRGQAA